MKIENLIYGFHGKLLVAKEKGSLAAPLFSYPTH
ncbi:hypothetical protein SAMN04489723_101432 [Algoriphagus aquimarinus]|uniref:Uncharacterized protein n=1 Tax=Algoriphagus aquimarinus TaxID=237018 RepID=A0A1I0VYH9_9BACT|nr:hypothetical protein SAMN04489723_101432 [Algoriphagus aquimarinus]